MTRRTLSLEVVGWPQVFVARLAVGGIGHRMIELGGRPRPRYMASHALVVVMVGRLILSVALGAVNPVCSGVLEDRVRHCQRRLGCIRRILVVVKQGIQIRLEQSKSSRILVFLDIQTKQDSLGMVYQRVDPGCITLSAFGRQSGQRLGGLDQGFVERQQPIYLVLS